MTMSLQITSPAFLDESFTTQMDLITGKIFYHSQLGEYLKMLPPDIGDGIYKSIWKYLFSNKVLQIPHPLKIDYFGENVSDASHSIIGEKISNLVERRRTQHLKEVRRMEEGSFRANPPDRYVKQSKARLDDAETMTIQDVKHYQISNSQFTVPHSNYDKNMIKREYRNRTDFPYSRSGFVLRGDRCMCFNKDGKVCGTSNYSHYLKVVRGNEMNTNPHERFESLIGRLNIGAACHSLHGVQIRLSCCKKHKKSYQGVITEEEMEDYCRSWGYTDEGHKGYWRKIDTRITSDTRTKKAKEVKGEWYKDVCIERFHARGMLVRRETSEVICKDIHLPQMSKTALNRYTNPDHSISLVSCSFRAKVEELGNAFNRLTPWDHGMDVLDHFI